MSHLDHHKVVANRVVNYACRWFALTTSAVTLPTFECYNENTSCDSKWNIYVISCPICNLQYVGQSNNFWPHMNGHKSDFRLHAAGKINKMDNKLLYDHLICHNID